MKDLYPQSVKNAKHNFDPSKARNKDTQGTALVAQPDSAAPAPAPEPADSTTDLVTRLKKLKGPLKAERVSFEEF